MSKRDKLMNVCGLPDVSNPVNTTHCFADSTHQTCCMLGPEARKYADSSGNPIGTAAEKAFKVKNGREATDNDLTPWCTCFGSKVCSYYANKFQDGTHIKFLNDMNNNKEVLTNVPKKIGCEEWARRSLDIRAHGTPGIIEANGETCSSKDINSIIRENIYDMNN
tara:strand:- start:391 stop:885 length:495 start_codon:yes stop_codon:yes gene_type:complete